MLRVVVTGAAGFIGRHVVRERASAGWEVVGIDRRPWAARSGESVVVADVRDDDVASLLGAADAVVHLAGAPGIRSRRSDVARRRWRDNVVATAVVAERAAPGAAVIVASSSSVYGGAGPVGTWTPCHEDDALDPCGGYARSKQVAERLARRARTGPGPTVVVRPFTVAGEGQRPDMALSTWLAAARAGRPVRILGGLDRRRDVSDVCEVAAAIGRLLDGGHDGTFNLGTGVTHSLAHHLDAVRHVTGRNLSVEVVPAARREVATTCADTTRLARAIGPLRVTPLRDLVARQDEARRTRRGHIAAAVRTS